MGRGRREEGRRGRKEGGWRGNRERKDERGGRARIRKERT
jgi:hypothetical protein